jgi:preprotein translocase subunit YajC
MIGDRIAWTIIVLIAIGLVWFVSWDQQQKELCENQQMLQRNQNQGDK